MAGPIHGKVRRPRHSTGRPGDLVTRGSESAGAIRFVLDLQRAAGNRAVARALAARNGDGDSLAGFPVLQRTPKAPQLTGQQIGTDASGTAVKIVRIVGQPDGYGNRWMATAAARLATIDPAAVFRRVDTERWCAALTNAPLPAGALSSAAAKGASAAFTEVHGLPSLADLPSATNNVTKLKVRLAELRAKAPASMQEKKVIEDEEGEVSAKLNAANEHRMALILGVPDKEVGLVRSVIGRAADKINVIANPEPNSPGGGHGPVAGQRDLDFHLDLVTAVGIDVDQFDDLGRARAVLFHEAHHLQDIRFAQDWVRAYQEDTKRLWVPGPAGVKPFQTWLNEQVKKKRLTAGDAQLVVDESRDVSATTEARANIHTFLTVLQVGDAAQARANLVAYARALPPGKQYGAPPPGSPVVTELIAELKGAYRAMSKPMQADFRAAVAAAVKENRSAWIRDLQAIR